MSWNAQAIIFMMKMLSKQKTPEPLLGCLFFAGFFIALGCLLLLECDLNHLRLY